MDESKLFENIFQTGRDPYEWLKEYIFYFASVGGGVYLFPDWFSRLETGYKGFGIEKCYESTMPDSNMPGKFSGFLYTVTNQTVPVPGAFRFTKTATAATYKAIRDCIDLKTWLWEYLTANAEDNKRNYFPEWWVKGINPNWTEWSILRGPTIGRENEFHSIGDDFNFDVKNNMFRSACAKENQKTKDKIIDLLTECIWDEIEEKKELK